MRADRRPSRHPGRLHQWRGTYFGEEFSGFGGMQNVGTSGQIQSQNYEEKPSFNANVTWVKGAHTFKFGAELYLEQAYTGAYSGVTLDAVGPTGIPTSTAQPFTPTTSLNGYNMGIRFRQFPAGRLRFHHADPG